MYNFKIPLSCIKPSYRNIKNFINNLMYLVFLAMRPFGILNRMSRLKDDIQMSNISCFPHYARPFGILNRMSRLKDYIHMSNISCFPHYARPFGISNRISRRKTSKKFLLMNLVSLALRAHFGILNRISRPKARFLK